MQSLNLTKNVPAEMSVLAGVWQLQSLNLTKIVLDRVSVLVNGCNLQSLNLTGCAVVNVSLTGSLTVDPIWVTLITTTFARPSRRSTMITKPFTRMRSWRSGSAGSTRALRPG